MRGARIAAIVMALVGTSSASGWTAERQIMMPRVPSEKLEEARALTSPLPDSADIVEKGKALYEGRGTCVNCHGATGRGDGAAAMGLDPSPRNFHHHGFWRHRTEGEIFWVIKHGSPGTAMIGFDGQLTDEEIWAIIQYERSFAGDHMPRRGMGPPEGMGRMRPDQEMGPRGPMGHMGPSDHGCCADPPANQ
jgi:mono/diheme cytochrome c family protein